jgi:hypothetical protein
VELARLAVVWLRAPAQPWVLAQVQAAAWVQAPVGGLALWALVSVLAAQQAVV